MAEKKNVQPCEACFKKEISDKLKRWIALLRISGHGTKQLVHDEMKEFLTEKLLEKEVQTH